MVCPLFPVDEDDGDLADPVPPQERLVQDFEDDGRADGDAVVEVDGLEDLPAEASEARRDVLHREAESPADEKADEERDEPADEAPVRVPPARDEPRAQDDIVPVHRRNEVRDVAGIVGEVPVHLDDEVRPEGQGGLEAVEAGGSPAPPLRPDEGADASVLPAHRLRDAPGPVGGIVVDHENVEVGVEREGEDRPDELGDVLRLVIGRDHHDDAAAFVGHGAQAMRCPTSSRTRPGRIPFMQTASGQVCL